MENAEVKTVDPPAPGMTLDAKFALVRSVGEECIEDNELRNLLEKKPDIRCYDGFEPSGRLHIAQGLFKAVNVNKCTAAGCTFIFWVGDWFALMNDKMGGDLSKIKTVGEYLIEVWTAAGMDMDRVQFKWSSDEIVGHAQEYWKRALDIGRRSTLARVKKCCQIMGRTEGTLSAAQILYPLMQCTDVFYLKADICQLGVDQRKVNMLARDYCSMIGKKLKPVILSHHMLSGLLEGQAKMSKSNPESAIFMEDAPEDVHRKIMNAYCPKFAQHATEVQEDGACVANNEKNPVLDYVQHIVFSRPEATFTAAEKTFSSYTDVELAFLGDELSEEHLKQGLITAINALLDPIRQHFQTNDKAKALLGQIQEWRKDAPAPMAAVSAEATEPHLVAWLPCVLKLPLNLVTMICEGANNFQGKVTVIIPDWSAFSANDLHGDEKGIDNVLAYNAALLKSVLPENATLLKQSEMILSDSSTYWLSAIAAGRKLSLDKIESSIPVSCAGNVVAALMRVADSTFLKATHVLDDALEGDGNSLVVDFTEGAIQRVIVPQAFPHLCDPKTRPTNADDTLFADDSEKDLQRKIKRAFAAPQDSCTPIIDIAKRALAQSGSFVVKRNSDQGGDKTFTDPAEIVQDYASGALHPGDLKTAALESMRAFTKKTRSVLTTPEVAKLATGVKNAEKKLAKAK